MSTLFAIALQIILGELFLDEVMRRVIHRPFDKQHGFNSVLHTRIGVSLQEFSFYRVLYGLVRAVYSDSFSLRV